MPDHEELSDQLYADPEVVVERRPDGSLLMSSGLQVDDHPPTLVHSLEQWAAVDPDHVLVAERDGDGWREVTYGEAWATARSVGQGLLERGLGPGRPLLILSGNSVAHLLLTLGAMTAGVPVAPVSVAYSLQSRDHQRIRDLRELVDPGAVFAEDPVAFGPALDALGDVPRLDLAELAATPPGEAVADSLASLTPDSLAKVLFTSGSTGTPKGVLTTHGMLAVNQAMIRRVWPFLAQERPVIVDWLPWSHTFGGNHNVGIVLANGGTLYVDDGRPVPDQFDRTLHNVADVRPTIYFNVPAGYAQLVPALESDPALAERFLSRIRLLFNAAAALPPALRTRLEGVAERTAGRRIPVTAAWGLTETAPAVTTAHFAFDDARSIGVPLPCAEVRLVPSGDAYEARVRGPMVTPGYVAAPELTAAAFDEEGFYRTGDAVDLADPDDPAKGLIFRGRIAEDFKLTTGTFVRVGAVRTALLSSVPLLADAVIAGENRDVVGALVWLNPGEVRKALGRELEPTDAEVVVDDELSGLLARAVAEHNRDVGSAARIERLLVMARPADLDAREITDKGYVNQRQVLTRRAHLVEQLYAEPPAPGVVHVGVVARTAS